MAVFETDCLECGKAFTAQRSTAKFCSARCRQRHNRAHPNMVNFGVEVSTARDALRRMNSLSDDELLREVWKAEKLMDEFQSFKDRVEGLI